MNKRWMICLSLVVLLSLSVVSAGFWDFFEKGEITGNVVSEKITGVVATASVECTSNPTLGGTASHAVDGNMATMWRTCISYYTPQWIELDLGKEYTLGSMNLRNGMALGQTHKFYMGGESNPSLLVETINTNVAYGGWINHTFSSPIEDVRYIRIVTLVSGYQTAWFEIEVYGEESGSGCVPDCDGKVCGDNGCGGSCGTCASGKTCNSNGQCISLYKCVQNSDCGSEIIFNRRCSGAGGTSACYDSITPTCANPGTTSAFCYNATISQCSPCLSGTICQNGTCVTPMTNETTCISNCSGKVCGSDGCDGNCGVCAVNKTCQEGTCVTPMTNETTCISNCSGKVCGSDGCDGNCGVCTEGKFCSGGTCVTSTTKGSTCIPNYFCEIEPVVCPSSGIQTKTCQDADCGEEDSVEEITCKPGVCSGCDVEEKCIPYGYRIEMDLFKGDVGNYNLYCDIDGELKEQRTKGSDGSWATCQNNYECESNICSSGECIDLASAIKEAGRIKKFFFGALCRVANPIEALTGGDEDYNQCMVYLLVGDNLSSGGRSGEIKITPVYEAFVSNSKDLHEGDVVTALDDTGNLCGREVVGENNLLLIHVYQSDECIVDDLIVNFYINDEFAGDAVFNPIEKYSKVELNLGGGNG